MTANHITNSTLNEGSLRILIVVNDRDQSDRLADLLESFGHKFTVAHNIEESRRRLREFDAQLAMIDLRLGTENGMDLVRELKNTRPDLKCMLLTANADPDNTIEALQEGVLDFLRKPLSPTSLSASLDRCAYQMHLESERNQAKAALKRERDRLYSALNMIPGFVYLLDRNHHIPFANEKFRELFGDPGDRPCYEIIHGRHKLCEECPSLGVLETRTPRAWEWTSKDNRVYMIHDEIFPGGADDEEMVLEIAVDITDRKRTEEALEKRIIALTQPLDESDECIEFSELFNLDEIQHIQDLFAKATGVASIITHTDGTPITRPSNFCRLCKDIIRQTPAGLEKCHLSDSIIGRYNPHGPTIQPCLSCGLWDAGASITVAGKHLANWLIGQIRNEAQDEQLIVKYAAEIGVDEDAFRAAYREVPVMSDEQFANVAQMLYAFAHQLSNMAYQNVQQARFIAERKRSEDELRQSEQRFRTLVEQASDAFFLLDPSDGMILEVNRRACKSLGYTREELLAMHIADIDIEVEKKHHKERFWDTIEPGAPVIFEGMQRRKDGATFPVEVSCDLIQIGPHMRMSGLVRDITERKETEELIKLNEARLEALVKLGQMIREPINAITDYALEEAIRLTKSRIGYLAFTNEDESILAIHSFSKTAMEQCRLVDKALLFTVETTGLLVEPIRQRKPVITNDYAAPNPLKKGCPQGHVKIERLMNVPVFEGDKIVAVAGVGNKDGDYDQADVRQLTMLMEGMWGLLQRKRAKEQVQYERDISAQIISSLPGLFYVFDEKRFVKWNPKWEAITGYSTDELAGLYGPDFFEGDDKKLIAERMQETFSKGAAEVEAEIVTKDGRKIPYFFTGARCVFDGAPHLVGLGVDITRRKNVEAEREQLITKLEAQNAELERFTYTVSHDLKSPLITVKGFVGMMQEDLAKGDAAAVKDDMARIGGAADKMDLLLKDLLELSRIGRLVNPSQQVNLTELAQEAMELVHGQIAKRGVTVEISPDMPTVYADRPRLLEVMQNLLDNAIKYMGDQRHPLVEIGSRREGEETICYVRDNGIGIEPGYQEKVFGLFEQLDQHVEGSGIGLALVKRIIKMHGGRIWVESQGAGQGATFCFTLAEKAGSL